MSTRAIPEGYEAGIPYLTIKGAERAIAFYKQAFGAVEVMRLPTPDGKIMHAELKIGGMHLMLSEESPEWGALSPSTIGDSGSTVVFYVDDAEAVVAQAERAGAKVTMPVADQFWGDRGGSLTDPFGHKWMVSTHIEDVSAEEMQRRAELMFAAGPDSGCGTQ
ncbi:MAG TPA: VOC family protein [Chitinolyticbacter sp.]|nr:VOC family protein [Chitinolyticbacter sp.]